MIHIVMDIFEITFSMFDYLLYVIIIMLIYGIKMIQKMPIILTAKPCWEPKAERQSKENRPLRGYIRDHDQGRP
jgi:hypothetical protein